MAFFLVHLVVTPPKWDGVTLQALREKEKAVAIELQEEGALVALWREAGRLASYSVWMADTLDGVRSHLERLPFYPHMEVELTEIVKHPNAIDPFPFSS